ADEPLRGSPIPLEPEDSRANRARAVADAAGSAADRQQPADAGDRSSIPPRSAVASALSVPADPTALPGSGARVVARPAEQAPQEDRTDAEGDADADGR
ncbi:two-component sensor histidine kinase, partial [Streptomyces sp. ISL-44]|nr:two-component sensor histidine kinase [Streptomyces sp. ISL-44]